MNDHYPTIVAATHARVYTCAMHLEVCHEGPGKCPACGMFLMPEGEVGTHDASHGRDRGHGSHGHHDQEI